MAEQRQRCTVEQMAHVLYRTGGTYTVPQQHLHASLSYLQIGFGVLVSVPGSSKVYPLLGRPHDSLEDHDAGYVNKAYILAEDSY